MRDQRIRVGLRLRPATPAEEAEGPASWVVESRRVIRRNTKQFTLDRVFDARTPNEVVYDEFAAAIVRDAMRGYHGAVLAYGQTSSGKTHTMQGTPDEPGLMPLAIEDCFGLIEAEVQSKEYALRVSYLEVYNETLVDLLGDSNIRLVDNGVRGAVEQSVASIGDVYEAIVRGEARRHVGETVLNSRSSRSHVVLRLTIESRGERGGTLSATLSFVDLAGSERAQARERQKEGSYINKSLHALAHVVAKLAESSPHIPYRDSKLTRLLKPALGGNARVAIVCTASAAPSAADETANTLLFAARAKRVQQSAKPNSVVDAESQLAAYRREVDDLKHQLAALEAKQREELGQHERLALNNAVNDLERLILRSGRAPVSPKNSRPEEFLAMPPPAPAQQRFFATGADRRRRRHKGRSLTLPPPKPSGDASTDGLLRDLEGLLQNGAKLCAVPLSRSHSFEHGDKPGVVPNKLPSLPEEDGEELATPEKEDPLAPQLLHIKEAIEQVLARGHLPNGDDTSRLTEALNEAKDDTAFVLHQLDAAEADNARLKAEVQRLTLQLQARDAELAFLRQRHKLVGASSAS